METSESSFSLTEDDYLAVLDIIHGLSSCETRDHLETVIKEIVFPLFKIQTFGSSWTDWDLNLKIQRHGKLPLEIGIGSEQAEVWQGIYPYHKDITRLFATSLRPVVAFDVDIPQANLKRVIHDFLNDHPQYDKPEFNTFHTITSFIAMSDPPDFNIGVGLGRFKPHEEPFTRREVRMAELIRPSLLRTLKFIVINEELQMASSLVEHLSRVPTPLCLVHPRGLIVFCNEAFQALTNWKQGEFLPKDLTAVLKENEQILEGAITSELSSESLVFYALPSGSVRCSWTRMKQPGDPKNGCWLLKMKPITDPYSQTLFLMKKAGLTRREMEVAARAFDGLDDADIAERLFISPNTLKNHLKSIYKKLNVHSRTQLVLVLRPPGEVGENDHG